jgi:hypothetical protein
MEASLKTKNRSAIRFSNTICTSRDRLKECNSGYYKGTYTSMFIAALFTIVKLWKQPRCPTADERIKKMWHLYTMEFYSATKKNEILSLAST